MADTTTRAEERCEKTELLQSSCAHCHPNPEAEKLVAALTAPHPERDLLDEPDAVPVELSPVFKAHYSSGRCTSCGEHIVRGEMIQHSGDGRYAHVDCP